MVSETDVEDVVHPLPSSKHVSRKPNPASQNQQAISLAAMQMHAAAEGSPLHHASTGSTPAVECIHRRDVDRRLCTQCRSRTPAHSAIHLTCRHGLFRELPVISLSRFPRGLCMRQAGPISRQASQDDQKHIDAPAELPRWGGWHEPCADPLPRPLTGPRT